MITITPVQTALSALASEQVVLQAALTAATAQGTQSYSVATATRTATTAVQTLTTSTTTEQAQVTSGDAAVTAALAARAAALGAYATALSAGGHPPLADAQATSLKTAIASANGVTAADIDAKGVAAVTAIDHTISGLGTQETTDLTAAQAALARAQGILVTKRTVALAQLASIQGSAADITARVTSAIASYTAATQAAAAADAASHHAAVVAYADYESKRTSLANDASTDPTGSVAQGHWTTAADEWMVALAAVADASEKVIVSQLALDRVMAAKAAKQSTRDGDAAAAVATAFGP